MLVVVIGAGQRFVLVLDALSIDVVIAELNKYSGTQFDPVVVDAFLRLLEDEGDAFISKNQKFDIYAFIEG